jgi:hypothetical protein
VRILPVILAFACGGEAPPLGTSGTTDTGAATSTTQTTTTTTTPTNQQGHLVYWLEAGGGPVQTSVMGYFSPSFDGLAVPAPCASAGRLCLETLPTGDGGFVDVTPTAYDPEVAGVGFVGFEILVGDFHVPFQVDPSTGFGAYAGNITEQFSPMSIHFDSVGEWGLYDVEEALPPAGRLELYDPALGALVEVDSALSVSWTPDPQGEIYIEIETAAQHRMWRFVDDGQAAIPAAELGIFDTNEIAFAYVYRVVTHPVLDANGNTLQLQSWSAASFRVAKLDVASCQTLHTNDPLAPSGVYTLQPDPTDVAHAVYCDMATDGGGWTLVASTLGTPPDDKADVWHSDLSTLSPATGHTGIWDGMRLLAGTNADVRFTCSSDAQVAGFDVDLSFYNVPWYHEFTTGTDAQSCFSENEGLGADPAPERMDNIGGLYLAAGDNWNTDGYLEGEDACGDEEDFTVDFDDRGMDGNQLDGTDWGEDDSVAKCGEMLPTADSAWFLFVREA